MTIIGFIGLGNMGKPMVQNLLKAGFQVNVYDVLPAAITEMEKEGAKAASDYKTAVQDADYVITMLQTGDQVKSACLGDQGIFEYVKRDVLYLDCSSIDISASEELHNIAKEKGIAMLDAPVSGGVAGAKAATLTLMVGGETKNFERAKTILTHLGKTIIHAGKAGHGQAAKICNNLILAISMIGVSEGFLLCEKLGLDPKVFFEISSHASGQCWSMTSYCPYPGLVENAPSNRQYEAGFMAKMMLKDLRLAEHAAEKVGVSLPLGEEATALYALFNAQGWGEMDFSAIIQFLAGRLKNKT